jgi:hypothetical protein
MRIRSVIEAGVALAIAGALASACSAKSSAPFPDVESFCQAVATAECQIASTCGIDPSDCKGVRAALCNANATDDMMSGTRKYVQANAQACLDVLNASNAYGGNNSRILYAQLVGKGSIDDVCGRVFSGNAADNESCTGPYDCANDEICSPALPGSTMLVCAVEVSVAPGKPCANQGSTCATDTYCAMPSAQSAYDCEPAKQDGQPCDTTTAPCVSTERCTSQVCEARVGANKSCTTSDDCDPSAPYCDPNVGSTCAPGLSFANGAPDCIPYRLPVSGDDASTPAVESGAD